MKLGITLSGANSIAEMTEKELLFYMKALESVYSSEYLSK